jgi:hypothetical protein
MTPDDAQAIRSELAQVREALAVVEGLQRESNGRLGKIEGRVFEIELWRARIQGAAATSRVVWLLAGGAITGIILELLK